MSFKPTEVSCFVDEYIVRNRLSKLGYRFEARDLMDFEVELLMNIDQIWMQEEMKLAKQKTKKGKNGRQ